MSERADGKLLAAGVGGFVVLAACVGIPSVMLDRIGETFGLSESLKGLIGSMRGVTLLPMVVASGVLADRFGKRMLLVLGSAAAAGGLGLMGSAPSYGLLLVASGVAGVGCGVFEAVVSPLVVEMYPARATARLNLVHASFNMGIVLSSASYLAVHWGGDWRVVFPWAALAGVVVTALFGVGRYPATVPGKEASASLGGILRRPLFWALVAAMSLTAGVELGATTWIANFIESETEAPGLYGAAGLGAFALAMMVGRLMTTGLARRVRPIGILFFSAVLGAGTIVIAAYARHWAVNIVFFGLTGVFIACFWPTILAYASERFGSSSSTLFALLSAAGILGTMLTPYLVGRIADASDLGTGIAALGALLVVSAIIFAGCWINECKREGSQPSE